MRGSTNIFVMSISEVYWIPLVTYWFQWGHLSLAKSLKSIGVTPDGIIPYDGIVYAKT
jgi:ABC-type nitrate/sulfonate/bicarbonate transport system permease component